ncbi:unnamed protein product [Ambrosiozyma monospora]|uniref:Unnamed protein product n=1 Tax=Ambrosiozyma monospora TaxID=43982 RepID=A0ACB5TYZ6_AMBMO|nr:unnamed protein product [Ambrosiozyma monospora]
MVKASPKSMISPVKIMEDDQFQIELPSKVDWKELGRQLMVQAQQLRELEHGALGLIHETYVNLIDLENTTQSSTASQFLQFLSIYHPFFRLTANHSNCYFHFPIHFKCNSKTSVR